MGAMLVIGSTFLYGFEKKKDINIIGDTKVLSV